MIPSYTLNPKRTVTGNSPRGRCWSISLRHRCRDRAKHGSTAGCLVITHHLGAPGGTGDVVVRVHDGDPLVRVQAALWVRHGRHLGLAYYVENNRGRGSRGGRSLKPEIFGGNHPITNVRRVFSCRIWDPEKKNGYRLCTADRTPYIARRTKLLGPTAVPLSTNTDPSREEDTPYRPYRRPNPSLPLHASLASTSTPPPTRGP